MAVTCAKLVNIRSYLANFMLHVCYRSRLSSNTYIELWDTELSVMVCDSLQETSRSFDVAEFFLSPVCLVCLKSKIPVRNLACLLSVNIKTHILHSSLWAVPPSNLHITTSIPQTIYVAVFITTQRLNALSC